MQFGVTEPERNRLVELVNKTAEDLGEHFEAVELLVTTSDDDGTWTYDRGSGNWNARKGMALEFLNSDAHKDQARYIASEIKRDEN